MATLKDVAARAGLSVTTVSRVLNNRGYLSEQTREKVYAAMRELNYHPNEVARSLLKKHTNSIGVIVPSVMHPFFAKVVNYLEASAAKRGFKLMLCNSHHQSRKEIEYIEMLKSNKVAGIILCSRTVDIDQRFGQGMPAVMFERAGGDICSVSCDNFTGGELAARHLIDCGCRRLVHIGGSLNINMPADLRCDGFVKACEQAKVPYRVFNTNEAQFLSMDYADFIADLLHRHPETDGVFASSDVIAAQVLQACHAQGIDVPGRLKLVGFDDVGIAALTWPPVTTIRQPVEQMCAYAVDFIAQQLAGEVVPLKTVLPVTLVQRGTT